MGRTWGETRTGEEKGGKHTCHVPRVAPRKADESIHRAMVDMRVRMCPWWGVESQNKATKSHGCVCVGGGCERKRLRASCQCATSWQICVMERIYANDRCTRANMEHRGPIWAKFYRRFPDVRGRAQKAWFPAYARLFTSRWR